MIKSKLDDTTTKVIDLINQNEDEKAFKIIVDTYNKQIYWHIRRMVLDHDNTNDVLQNTYLKIWKALAKFKGNSKIYTWVYRIATNESLTFLSKENKKPISLEIVKRAEPQTNSQTELIDSESIQKKLDLAIATLPTKQRAVFNLKYFEELKYKQISKITNTSIGALKASYHLAVKKIERYLTSN